MRTPRSLRRPTAALPSEERPLWSTGLSPNASAGREESANWLWPAWTNPTMRTPRAYQRSNWPRSSPSGQAFSRLSTSANRPLATMRRTSAGDSASAARDGLASTMAWIAASRLRRSACAFASDAGSRGPCGTNNAIAAALSPPALALSRSNCEEASVSPFQPGCDADLGRSRCASKVSVCASSGAASINPSDRSIRRMGILRHCRIG